MATPKVALSSVVVAIILVSNGQNANVTCPEDSIPCHDWSNCVKKTAICNSVIDCLDTSDESFCGSTNCTAADEFACLSGDQCVVRDHVCDHGHDCDDGSDETICDPAEQCRQKDGRYLCHSNLQCINIILVCDGTPQCHDESDEGQLCEKARSECLSGKCDNCTALPDGATCTCSPGYTLQNTSCADIDECETENRPCSQNCVNTLGSYQCSCHHGYHLVNHSKCVAESPEPILLITTMSELLAYHPRSNKAVTLKADFRYNTKGISIGPQMILYFSDIKTRTIYSTNLQGDQSLHINTVINVGLKSPSSITVDWLTGHIYIADQETRQILMCLSRGEACTVIHSSLKPVALTIDQKSRHLYWSESGMTACIRRSRLHGSSQENFVIHVGLVKGMVVDNTVALLFWADFKNQRIESIGLDGSNRKILLATDGSHPFGITVFEDSVYWSDLHLGMVKSANKFTGNNVQVILHDNGYPAAMAMQHPVIYNITDPENPCSGADCTDICIPSNNNNKGYRCFCPQDMVLHHDNRTCYRNPDLPRIFLGARKNILHFPLFTTGYQNKLVHSIISTKIENPYSIDVDLGENYVVYSDMARDVIAKVFFSRSRTRQMEEVLYSENLHTVEDIAVDVVTGNIYWVDTGKGTIEVGDINGRYHSILIQGHQDIKRPNSIALDTPKGILYFSDMGRTPFIGRCNMDGSKFAPVVRQGVHPNDVTLDGGRLYYTDGELHKIISISIPSGTDRLVHWHHYERVPFSLAVHRNNIYWIELDKPNLYMVDKGNNNKEMIVLKNVLQMRSVTVYDMSRYTNVTNACSVNNGNCSHLCLSIPMGRKCVCSDGFTLKPDGISCERLERCDGFLCEDGHCIQRRFVCDSNPDCLDESDENKTLCDEMAKDTRPSPLHKTGTGCNNHNCQHVCQPTSSGALCQCHQGYQLKPDQTSCEDIDECKIWNGGCSQKCVNTEGSYLCQCVKGYESRSNGTMCNPQDPKPYLIVLDRSKVTVVMDEGQERVLDLHDQMIETLDVVMETGDILFSTISTKSSIYRYYSFTKNTSKLYQGEGLISELAYDWMGQNLYIGDVTSKTLQACSLGYVPLVCKSLLHEKIASLVLFPQKGQMFWVNPMSKAIEKSWMTGRQRQHVITDALHAPSSLALDVPAERLYWLNKHNRKIESCRLDGSERFTILQDVPLDFTSIDVFGNSLYITDQEEHRVQLYSKFGVELMTLVRDLAMPKRVKVVHPLKQEKADSPCDSLQCSHLCLLTPDGATCACPDGWKLQSQSLQTNCLDPWGPTTTEVTTMQDSTSVRTLVQSTYRKHLPEKIELQPSSSRNDSTSTVHVCHLLCLNGGYCAYYERFKKYYCRCRDGYSGSLCNTRSVTPKPASSKTNLIIGVLIGILAVLVLLCASCWYCKRKSRSREGVRHLVYFRPLLKRRVRREDAEGLVGGMKGHHGVAQQFDVYEDLDQADREENGIPNNISSLSLDSAFVSHQEDTINDDLGDSLDLIPNS